jgi:hypothetical protein
MANTNSPALGATVVNFSTTARVVGFFKASAGVSQMDGWPILREVGASGRLRGGKWVADPSKCSAATTSVDEFLAPARRAIGGR